MCVCACVRACVRVCVCVYVCVCVFILISVDIFHDCFHSIVIIIIFFVYRAHPNNCFGWNYNCKRINTMHKIINILLIVNC